jgi:hypothetical protein
MILKGTRLGYTGALWRTVDRDPAGSTTGSAAWSPLRETGSPADPAISGEELVATNRYITGKTAPCETVFLVRVYGAVKRALPAPGCM